MVDSIELQVPDGEDLHPDRLGRITSSGIHAVLSLSRQGDKKSSATRNNYLNQLVLERITGKKGTSFKSEAMNRGNEMEDSAAFAYELRTGEVLEKCGFYARQDIMAGSSPDRRVRGKNKIIQIKCFEPTEHKQVLKLRRIPPKYRLQMIDELANTNFDENVFVSYNPDFPTHAQLYIESIYRKDVEDEIEGLENEKLEFLREVEAEVQFIQNYKEGN